MIQKQPITLIHVYSLTERGGGSVQCERQNDGDIG